MGRLLELENDNCAPFAKSMIESIADAGKKFLDLRLRGSPVRMLIKLCDDLISHEGVASGVALAREVVHLTFGSGD